MRRLLITLSICTLTIGHIHGQTGADIISLPEHHYDDAQLLLDATLFGAGRMESSLFTERFSADESILTEHSAFDKAIAAKDAWHGDAIGLMKEFLSNYPQSNRRDDMLYHIGDLTLKQGSVGGALRWFEKVKEKRLTTSLKDEFFFKKGYCLFMRGKHKLGLAQFDKLTSSNQYTSSVKYYRAHVDYEEGNLNAALKSFADLEKDPVFKDVAPYYIAHILYLQGSYTEAIRYAQPLVANGGNKDEGMIRILADCHFNLAQWDNALQYYNTLLKKVGNKALRADYYHAGITCYKINKYADAIPHLTQVTKEKDELGQNAYYHLADCYLKTGDKAKARMAFESASNLKFDRAIQEDSHFNKIKLAYELNFLPFNDIISQFVEFTELYPNSDKKDECYDIMSKAFVTNKNYDKALKTLSKIQHKNLAVYTLMQRLAFYRGLELYTDARYGDAIDLFNQSISYGQYDAKIKARSYYWKGESLYRQNKTDEAYEQYFTFINAYSASELEEFTTAHYNIAYTRFNKKRYNDAKQWFIKYVSLNVKDKRLLADAYNRLGDCMYADRNFRVAIENYDKALAASAANGDYSMLQRAICIGFTQNNEVKIKELKSLIEKYPKSRLCGHAYYEIARAHVALEQITDAIYNFKVVKERYPKSSLASKSMLQLGLLYYNNSEYDNSMAFYKRVINEYPSTPEAADALAGLRNVYMELGDFDGYMAYTKTLGAFARMDSQEQDSLMFVSAQRLYFKGDKKGAISGLQRYLGQFPDGRNVTGANFYLAECYYDDGDLEKALSSYQFVTEQPRSLFSEDALIRTGGMLFNRASYGDALKTFERLEEEAEVPNNRIEAIIGQMRCAEKIGDNEKCLSGADKVIAMEETTPEILREAKYLKAKTLHYMKRDTEALPLWRELAESTVTEEGAESKYLIAQYLYDNNDAERAEKEIFDYIEKGTPHQYWLARSFVLLADIYHLRGDDFQARQYLESLQESYKAEDDIREMIEQRIETWHAGTSSLDM
ncbi:MAG: tetratricopeptide repeat protein [Marinilabiliaceae bacterium]|nr:tetratricopeptide repeat protein [Marinilabiliaceae bacterium]